MSEILKRPDSTDVRAFIMDRLAQGEPVSPEERMAADQMRISQDSEFTKGLRRFGYSALATTKAFAGTMAAPFAPSTGQALIDDAARGMREMPGSLRPQYDSFEQARQGGLSGLGTYVAGALGEGLPSSVLSLAGGIGGRAIGALAGRAGLGQAVGAIGTMLPMEGGETALDLASNPTAMANTTALGRAGLSLGRGTLNAALESAVPNLLVAPRLLGQAAKIGPGLGNAARNVGLLGAAGAAGEYGTEFAQDLTGQGVMKYADPSTRFDFGQANEAGIRGAITGGVLGGAGGVAQGLYSNAAPAAEFLGDATQRARTTLEDFAGRTNQRQSGFEMPSIDDVVTRLRDISGNPQKFGEDVRKFTLGQIASLGEQAGTLRTATGEALASGTEYLGGVKRDLDKYIAKNITDPDDRAWFVRQTSQLESMGKGQWDLFVEALQNKDPEKFRKGMVTAAGTTLDGAVDTAVSTGKTVGSWMGDFVKGVAKGRPSAPERTPGDDTRYSFYVGTQPEEARKDVLQRFGALSPKLEKRVSALSITGRRELGDFLRTVLDEPTLAQNPAGSQTRSAMLEQFQKEFGVDLPTVLEKIGQSKNEDDGERVIGKRLDEFMVGKGLAPNLRQPLLQAAMTPTYEDLSPSLKGKLTRLASKNPQTLNERREFIATTMLGAENYESLNTADKLRADQLAGRDTDAAKRGKEYHAELRQLYGTREDDVLYGNTAETRSMMPGMKSGMDPERIATAMTATDASGQVTDAYLKARGIDPSYKAELVAVAQKDDYTKLTRSERTLLDTVAGASASGRTKSGEMLHRDIVKNLGVRAGQSPNDDVMLPAEESLRRVQLAEERANTPQIEGEMAGIDRQDRSPFDLNTLRESLTTYDYKGVPNTSVPVTLKANDSRVTPQMLARVIGRRRKNNVFDDPEDSDIEVDADGNLKLAINPRSMAAMTKSPQNREKFSEDVQAFRDGDVSRQSTVWFINALATVSDRGLDVDPEVFGLPPGEPIRIDVSVARDKDGRVTLPESLITYTSGSKKKGNYSSYTLGDFNRSETADAKAGRVPLKAQLDRLTQMGDAPGTLQRLEKASKDGDKVAKAITARVLGVASEKISDGSFPSTAQKVAALKEYRESLPGLIEAQGRMREASSAAQSEREALIELYKTGDVSDETMLEVLEFLADSTLSQQSADALAAYYRELEASLKTGDLTGKALADAQLAFEETGNLIQQSSRVDAVFEAIGGRADLSKYPQIAESHAEILAEQLDRLRTGQASFLDSITSQGETDNLAEEFEARKIAPLQKSNLERIATGTRSDRARGVNVGKWREQRAEARREAAKRKAEGRAGILPDSALEGPMSEVAARQQAQAVVDQLTKANIRRPGYKAEIRLSEDGGAFEVWESVGDAPATLKTALDRENQPMRFRDKPRAPAATAAPLVKAEAKPKLKPKPPAPPPKPKVGEPGEPPASSASKTYKKGDPFAVLATDGSILRTVPIKQVFEWGGETFVVVPTSENKRPEYQVLHADTSLVAGVNAPSIRKAVDSATKRLEAAGPERVRELVAKAKKPPTESKPAETKPAETKPAETKPAVKPAGRATPEFDKLPAFTPGQKNRVYAGIGSRETPPEILAVMREVAKRLAEAGYTLRSGNADGADKAFEAGAGRGKQIFLAKDATPQTLAIAQEIHPAWGALKSEFARRLMARNTNQIFGKDLDMPADFVLAWTRDGAESTADRSIKTGGTGQAIDMASRKGIPVINLAKPGWEQRLEQILGAKDAAAETKPAVKPAAPAPLKPQNVVQAVSQFRKQIAQATTADQLAQISKEASESNLPDGAKAAVSNAVEKRREQLGATRAGQAKPALGPQIELRIARAPTVLAAGMMRRQVENSDLSAEDKARLIAAADARIAELRANKQAKPAVKPAAQATPAPKPVAAKSAKGKTLWRGSTSGGVYDQYDDSRMGSGEGTNTLGVGHYFSEDRAVAEEYVGMAAESSGTVHRVESSLTEENTLDWSGGTQSDAVMQALTKLGITELPPFVWVKSTTEATADRVVAQAPGAVKESIGDGKFRVIDPAPQMTGANIYRHVTGALAGGDKRAASKILFDAGVQGARTGKEWVAYSAQAVPIAEKIAVKKPASPRPVEQTIAAYESLIERGTSMEGLAYARRTIEADTALSGEQRARLKEALDKRADEIRAGIRKNGTPQPELMGPPRPPPSPPPPGSRGGPAGPPVPDAARQRIVAMVARMFGKRVSVQFDAVIKNEKASGSYSSLRTALANVRDERRALLDALSDGRWDAETSTRRSLTPKEAEQARAKIASLAAEEQRLVTDTAVLGVIRLAAGAEQINGLAEHEAFHGAFTIFFNKEERSTIATAFTRGIVGRRLREHFKDSPEVLEVIDPASSRFDSEEAAAYGFQVWMADPDMLKVGDNVKSYFQRVYDFFRKLIGVLSPEEKAQMILRDLQTGRRAETDLSPLAKVLDRDAPWTERAQKFARDIGGLLKSFYDILLTSVYNRMVDTQNPALARIADLGYKPTGTEGNAGGFVQRDMNQTLFWRNRLDRVIKGLTDKELAALHEAKILDVRPTDAKLAERFDALTTFYKDIRDYQVKAGIKMGNLTTDPVVDETGKVRRAGRNYYPLSFDPEVVNGKKAEFIEMLKKYPDQMETLKATPDEIWENITAYLDRGENLVDVMGKDGTPVAEHVRARKLDFISPADRLPFMGAEPVELSMRYIKQAVRQAEFVRSYGMNGSKLQELRNEAITKYGATVDDMKLADDYIDGLIGNKEVGMSRELKDLYGGLAVYTNFRLLPFAVFSSLVDPLGIAVRSGNIGDAWEAFTYSIKNLFREWKQDYTKDQHETLAEDLGIITDAGTMISTDALYTGVTLRGTTAKLNEKLFRYNLLDGWIRKNTIMAVRASQKFMYRASQGFFGAERSERYLKELGLEKDDIVFVPKLDRLAVTEQELIDAGKSAADAAVISEKLRNATDRFVRQSLLVPNAAELPNWASNPYLAPIAHLKSFVFAFQATIIDRLMHEANNGNYRPMMIAAAYVPGMIAADFLKDMVSNAGEEPPYKKDWGVADYVSQGVNRSGLTGVGSFFSAAQEDIMRGGSGLESAAGPAAAQLKKLVGALSAETSEPIQRWLIDALPANAAYDQFFEPAR